MFNMYILVENLNLYKTQLKLNVFNWQIKVLYDIERGNIFLDRQRSYHV